MTEIAFANSGWLRSAGFQWPVCVCACACVRACVCAACAMCMCVSSFTWWSEVPTKAHMASDGWSADRQRHKECEFISVALTELIVMGH